MVAEPIPPLFTDDYWDRAIEVTDVMLGQAAVHQAKVADLIRVWVIVGYDQAREALQDPRLSKDAAGLKAILGSQFAKAGQPDRLSRMFSPHMLFSDGDAHARLRRLVVHHFSRTEVAKLRGRVERITAELIDSLPTDRPVDLCSRLAFPLPLTVICELLGIPDHDHGRFREWTSALMHDLPERTLPASDAMTEYFTDIIATRQRSPANDLLSTLIHGAADGDRLTEDELLGTLFLLFVAGHETTTNLITNSTRWLLAEPDRWRSLRGNVDAVARSIDEVMRWDSPVRMASHRYTTEPVVYGGVRIPAGQVVLVSLHSANRDPARFERARELDIERDARGHLGFGHGPHYCLGAHLGRLEAEIALTQLTDRFPAATLAVPAQQLRRQPSVIMNGHVDLPVHLTPRS